MLARSQISCAAKSAHHETQPKPHRTRQFLPNYISHKSDPMASTRLLVICSHVRKQNMILCVHLYYILHRKINKTQSAVNLCVYTTHIVCHAQQGWFGGAVFGPPRYNKTDKHQAHPKKKPDTFLLSDHHTNVAIGYIYKYTTKGGEAWEVDVRRDVQRSVYYRDARLSCSDRA